MENEDFFGENIDDFDRPPVASFELLISSQNSQKV